MRNENVAHSFIYDEDSEGKGSNFKFIKNKLYSYNSLMARIDRNKKIILIDEHISDYSNTSRKHRSNLLKAIPSNYSVFEWRWRDSSYIESQYNLIIEMLHKQSRARTSDYSKSIANAISSCTDYEIEFPEEISENDKELLIDILRINVQELISSSSHLIEKSKEKLIALKAKDDERKQDSKQLLLNKFLGHSNVKFNPNYNSVYLKVIEDKLYTSNSIIVNVIEAITLYKAYLAGKNILNARLGSYTVLKSSKESVTIGCTTISAIELNRVLGKYLNSKSFDEQTHSEPEYG